MNNMIAACVAHNLKSISSLLASSYSKSLDASYRCSLDHLRVNSLWDQPLSVITIACHLNLS